MNLLGSRILGTVNSETGVLVALRDEQSFLGEKELGPFVESCSKNSWRLPIAGVPRPGLSLGSHLLPDMSLDEENKVTSLFSPTV